MLRALPATTFFAASKSKAFKSGILILAISSTSFMEMVPTCCVPGLLDPFFRLAFFNVLKMNPPWFKSLAGTVVVTSVGMFGKGGGWGIGFLPTHNLGVTVGGINQKPGVFEGAIAIREYLHLTLSFDHDIIDGAPAARFASKLNEMLSRMANEELKHKEKMEYLYANAAFPQTAGG